MNTNQWDDHAQAYQAYFNDTDDRVSSTQVFPRIIGVLGQVKGKRVLDIGCGQGRFSRAFHDLGAQVAAYDISPKETEIAISMDESRGITYTHDSTILKSRNAFDLVFCFMALLCNPRDQALELLQAAYECLAPGGMACFTNTNTETLGQRFKDFFSEPPAERKAGVPYKTIIPNSQADIVVTDYYYSPEDLRTLFASACFVTVHEEVVAEQFVFHVLRKK
ncbi:MAG: methyltransferase domain-containing protein [Desulfobacterales bacterium]|nr:methyltransferase domain-containing protein [Desulfobacterales bacterium]